MKWIILLRHPVDRAYSQWNMWHRLGRDTSDFASAIPEEEVRCRTALPLQHRYFSYADSVFYSEQLRRIWRYFPRQQTLILKSEEFRSNPRDVLAQVPDFLGVTREELPDPEFTRSGDYTAPVNSSDCEYLLTVLASEVRTIESLLGWNCDDWRL